MSHARSTNVDTHPMHARARRYRAFNANEAVYDDKCDTVPSAPQRLVRGVDGMIADVCSFSLMLESLATSPGAPGTEPIRAAYHIGPEDFVVAGNTLMCRWLLLTENAVACGAPTELYKSGMLRATFSRTLPNALHAPAKDSVFGTSAASDGEALPLPASAPFEQPGMMAMGPSAAGQYARRPHDYAAAAATTGTPPVKLQRLDLLFDVMGFMQLLQSATMSGNPRSTRMEFPVVPNMLGMVLTEERWSGNNEGRPIAAHEIGACAPSVDASAETSAGTSVDTPPTGGESRHPRVITLATPPFTITHVNAVRPCAETVCPALPCMAALLLMLLLWLLWACARVCGRAHLCVCGGRGSRDGSVRVNRCMFMSR